MQCPSLADLPAPGGDRCGWPWTEDTPRDTPFGKAPRISIVTPSFNQGRFLEETIRSVLLQRYPDLDYIIVDGGSTDESLAIIRKYERWLTYWTSEPDRGQCHAINKGLMRATGVYFNYVNSDDVLMPSALAAVAAAFERHPHASLIHGRCALGDERARTVTVHQGSGRDFEDMFRSLALGNGLHPLAAFVRREAVIDAGGYREDREQEMDSDLWFRLLERGAVVTSMEACLGVFRCHATQKSASHRRIDELLSVLLDALARRSDMTGRDRDVLARLARRQCASQKMWSASSSFRHGAYRDYATCCTDALKIDPSIARTAIFWRNVIAPLKALVPERVMNSGRRRLRRRTRRPAELAH